MKLILVITFVIYSKSLEVLFVILLFTDCVSIKELLLEIT